MTSSDCAARVARAYQGYLIGFVVVMEEENIQRQIPVGDRKLHIPTDLSAAIYHVGGRQS